jgi:peptidyl-prolyl cis-trans isomerase C
MAGRDRLRFGVAGVLLAFLSLSACGKPEAAAPTTAAVADSAVAAVVNGEPIYVSDVNLEAEVQDLIDPGEKLEIDSAEFDDILDQLIDIKLLAQEATSRGLDEDPQARHRLATARDNILGNILIDAVVAERVDEAAMKKMYDEQVRILEQNGELGDEAHVRHILAPTKDAIDRIAAELKAGADFSVLASRKSTDAATKMEGGDLGYMKADDAPPELAKIIRDTPTGGISKPFETEDGWHVVKIDERRKEEPPPIEELRGRILKFLTTMQIGDVLKELRTEARIEKQTSPRNSKLTVDPFETAPEQPASRPTPSASVPPSIEAAGPKPPAETAAPPAATGAKPATPPASAPAQQPRASAPATPPSRTPVPAPATPTPPVGESRQPSR